MLLAATAEGYRKPWNFGDLGLNHENKTSEKI
jgi:hypothetical protein